MPVKEATLLQGKQTLKFSFLGCNAVYVNSYQPFRGTY